MKTKKIWENKINNSYYQHHKFEWGKNTDEEYKILTPIEMSYVTNGYIIYKQIDMNNDYETTTYFIKDDELIFQIIHHCDTNEYQYKYYLDGKHHHTDWYNPIGIKGRIYYPKKILEDEISF